MKSFFFTTRLFAFQSGLPIKPMKPKYLIPSTISHLSSTLKSNDLHSEYREKSPEEIQANSFLHLAKEYHNKKEVEKAQENLDKAFLLAEFASENEFSRDLISKMHFLQGYLLLQKKELKSAYSNFNTFLQLRDQYSQPQTVQDIRFRLEITRILISNKEIPGLEASIEKLIDSLTHNETGPEQLILKAQCHQVLSEYNFSIGNPDIAITNGGKCLEVLEAPELKNSHFGPKIASMKLEVAKSFIKYYERAYEPSRSSHFDEAILQVSKVIKETKAELGVHRGIFVFILPKFFELLVKYGNNTEINQEIFGILKEAKFEEKEFPSKNEYIEYLLTLADNTTCLEHYTQMWKWP